MEHELIDYYDENGTHLGVIDKAIAHSKGLWHKSVHVWIVNDTKQVLLQKRCSQKKFFPNFWDCSFAGHIGAGETSIISAIREAKEEIGLTIEDAELNFLFTEEQEYSWDKILSREFVDVYVLHKNIDTNTLTFQEEEVENAEFVNLEKLSSLFLSKKIIPHNKEFECLKTILS
ncbi:MAG: NUDIX domain-containing protein [Clostridia bacterium]|nr:NUDIX domain-containing protein [Clostridia bacterium]